MKEEQIQDELVSIRKLMERSSKFISLSGLSGILAGVYALIGAGFVYYYVYYTAADYYAVSYKSEPVKGLFYGNDSVQSYAGLFVAFSFNLKMIFFVAFLVLAFSIGTGLILTIRTAKKKGQSIWGKTSRLMLFNLAVPLLCGGLFILLLINQRTYLLVLPVSLIFYGLALFSASNYTFTDVKYLGLCEIVLGLIAASLPGWGLLFWAIGFGLLHIVYGSVMYFKYDR